MMIFRLTRRLSLIALALMSLLSALSVWPQEALAFYDGSHISVEADSQIPIGYTLSCGVTVKNTGTDVWYSYKFSPTDPPGWIIVVRNLSWSPDKSYQFNVRFAVQPGAISVSSAGLTPEQLPSWGGNYSFQVYAYYPKDYYSSEYLLMDNSPKFVNFTMLPKPPTLSVSTASLNQNCPRGQNASIQSFEVWNSGQDSIAYTITHDVEWLSVSPGSGSSVGEHDVIQVIYNTSALSAGTYNGKITVTAPGEDGSPQTITVTLRVSAGTPWIGLLLEGDE